MPSKRISSILTCLTALALLAPAPRARAQAFPADADYVAAECGGALSTDPARDESGAQGGRDLVGDATDAVIFIADTEDHLFIRMRVDDDPTGPGGFDQFGWVFLIDTDGDLSTFEFHVSLDGVGEEVTLSQNTVTDAPNDPEEEPDAAPLNVYPSGTHAQASEALSSLDGELDYFISFAVDKADLEAAAVPTGLFSVWAGTSSNARALNGDIACFDNSLATTPTLESIATDPVIIGTFVTVDSPTEGAVVTDATPTVTGTTEPGNTVLVSVDGGEAVPATVDGAGDWTVTLPSLTNGEHTIEVTATDEAESDVSSATVTFTVDTADVDECALGTDTCDANATCTNATPGFTCACNAGFSGDGTSCFGVVISSPLAESVVTDPTPTVTGTSEPNATIQVTVDGAPGCTTVADAAGDWSCDVTTPVADGARVIEARTPDGEASDRITVSFGSGGTDTDGDGIPDAIEQPGGVDRDTDDDGTPDHLDDDDDGDGIPTADERADTMTGGVDTDIDGDGLPNWRDPDADGDGTNDGDEGEGDSNDDGVPDYLDRDVIGAGPTEGGVAGGAMCSVGAPDGSGSGAGGALLFLALGAGLVVRRRSRSGAVSMLALGATLGATSGALAQVQLDGYRAPENTVDGFAVRSTDVNEHGTLEGQLVLDYAHDPLVYETDLGNPGSESEQIVAHQLNATGLLSFGLFDRALVYVGLPVVLVMNGDELGGLAVARADGAGLGDLFLGGRVRILGDRGDGFGLGAQVTLTLPTANAADGAQAYRGDRSVSFAPVILADYRAGRLRFVGNLGARIRANQGQPGDTTIGDELSFGIGASYAVIEDTLEVHADLYGTTSFQDFFDREATFFELLAGARYRHESGLSAGLAVGPGLVRGYGSPDIRVVGAVGFRRDLIRERAPVDEPLEPGPGDRDGDGILDDVDACADEAEDFDQFDDADGCPDPDNDGDGVLDVNDGAPLEPEDADDFEDADGVPDPDNDGDGTPDASDACPNEAGLERNRGCPDRDRDADTVLDRVDNCPDQPGAVENQGCPEAQRVQLEEGRLRILENVFFATNSDRILSRSFPLLDNVARVLTDHPEIELVRVEGHTDARGSRDHNLSLSQRRAESVVRYLVEKGVDAGRLQARGFGPDRPVVENARTGAEHAQNRRVEFNLGGEVEGVQQPGE